jgi:hypothetical protein
LNDRVASLNNSFPYDAAWQRRVVVVKLALQEKEKAMRRRFYLFVLASVLLLVGIASTQDYPILEKIAQKVIQKYQTSAT